MSSASPLPFRTALIQWLLLSAGLGVLWVAVPYTKEAITLTPVTQAVRAYERQTPPSSDQVSTVVNRAADLFVEPVRYPWSANAYAAFLLYGVDLTAYPMPEADRATLFQVERLLRASLAQRPNNPYDWFRLAQVRHVLGYARQDVLTAWHLSLMVGRYEQALFIPRATLGLEYEAALIEAGLWPALTEQIEQAYEYKSGATTFLLSRKRRPGYMRRYLVNRPNDLQAFENGYRYFLTETLGQPSPAE